MRLSWAQREISAAFGRAVMDMADKNPDRVHGCVHPFLSAYRDLTWAARRNFERHENKRRLEQWKAKKEKL